MTATNRRVVILSLVDNLREKGSWCGETHIQKATYFLQELMEVPTELSFILYKHGPFSFDLRGEINGLLADELLELEVQPMPYGPSFRVTDQGYGVLGRFPRTAQATKPAVDFVADVLCDKKASELEQLATALYFTLQGPSWSTEDKIAAITGVKPHITSTEAHAAIHTIDRLFSTIRGLRPA